MIRKHCGSVCGVCKLAKYPDKNGVNRFVEVYIDGPISYGVTDSFGHLLFENDVVEARIEDSEGNVTWRRESYVGWDSLGLMCLMLEEENEPLLDDSGMPIPFDSIGTGASHLIFENLSYVDRLKEGGNKEIVSLSLDDFDKLIESRIRSYDVTR